MRDQRGRRLTLRTGRKKNLTAFRSSSLSSHGPVSMFWMSTGSEKNVSAGKQKTAAEVRRSPNRTTQRVHSEGWLIGRALYIPRRQIRSGFSRTIRSGFRTRGDSSCPHPKEWMLLSAHAVVTKTPHLYESPTHLEPGDGILCGLRQAVRGQKQSRVVLKNAGGISAAQKRLQLQNALRGSEHIDLEDLTRAWRSQSGRCPRTLAGKGVARSTRVRSSGSSGLEMRAPAPRGL